MAISFPTSLDTLTNPTSTSALNSPAHATQHSDINDAVEALETKLGANGAPITMTTTTMLFGTTNKLEFRDSAVYIASLTDGHLDLEADISIDLNAPVAIVGAVDITGAVDIAGALTATSYGGILEAALCSKTAATDISNTWEWQTTNKIQFRDSAIYLASLDDGHLDVEADVSVDINAPLLFVNETSNASMTTGITIQQSSADNEILAFKSTDVAHGVTDITETDTYGLFKKNTAAEGGLRIAGFAEGWWGLDLWGYTTTGNSGHTSDQAVSAACVHIKGIKKSGTGAGALGANENILAVSNNTTIRFFLDGDGDSWQDTGDAWTNFDDHDDIALLNALSGEVTLNEDPLKKTFSKWLGTAKDVLEKHKIVTFNEDGHHFINWSRTHMLEIGAIRQLAERLDMIENKLELLGA